MKPSQPKEYTPWLLIYSKIILFETDSSKSLKMQPYLEGVDKISYFIYHWKLKVKGFQLFKKA